MKCHYRTVIFLVLMAMVFASCKEKPPGDDPLGINIEHLKHLYTHVELKSGVRAGVLHIYSEYPDYDYTIEQDEGFTCVDDVARAIVFLSGYHGEDDETETLSMMSDMTAFILEMQSENGYFFNFLWDDGSINKIYRTSIPEPNWWSWRALWALSEVCPLLPEDLAERARYSSERLISVVLEEYLNKPLDTIRYKGLGLPNWYPFGTAFDQSALLIMAMISYHNNIKQDERVLALIERFSEGLLLTQKGNENQFPYNAFMSWNNLWHAYGNIQSCALLQAAALLERDDLRSAALKEIDHFYPYLLEHGIAHHFYLEQNDNGLHAVDYTLFPQIAYGIRPIAFACLEAYDQTGKKEYLEMAEQAVSWLLGNNPAGSPMYDPSTGRCYDGIVSDTVVNLNSGAESTIEALLALQALHHRIRK